MLPMMLPKLPLSNYSLPKSDPPRVPGSLCNIAMPSQSTRTRFLWVCSAWLCLRELQTFYRISACSARMSDVSNCSFCNGFF